jgi:hypothetical protein
MLQAYGCLGNFVSLSASSTILVCQLCQNKLSLAIDIATTGRISQMLSLGRLLIKQAKGEIKKACASCYNLLKMKS